MRRTESYAYYFTSEDREVVARALTAYKNKLKAEIRDAALEHEKYNQIEIAAADEIARVMELAPEHYQPEEINSGAAANKPQDPRQHIAEQLKHKTYGQIPAQYRSLVTVTVRPAQRKSTKYLLTFRIPGAKDKNIYMCDDEVSYKRAAANILPALQLASELCQFIFRPRPEEDATRQA